LQSCAALLASEGNPELMKQQAVILKNAVAKLGNAGKAIVTTHPDPAAREVSNSNSLLKNLYTQSVLQTTSRM
jgi:hypothetical protein